jgi:hypothetical protein
MIEELDVRLTALADPTDDSSWTEVLSRADELRERRRPRLAVPIAAALVLTVVVVTPAVGVRGRIVHLFAKAEPAPQRIEKSFAALGGTAPPLGPGVEADRAVKVLETPVGAGVRAVLWVAPTARGGFCSAVELEGLGGAGAECLQLRYDRLSVEVSLHGRATEGAVLNGAVLIDGFTGTKRADSLVLRFQDGESQRIPLVWVSAPVDTGFFVYGLPERHWRKGHLPTALTLLAADGDELDQRDIHGIPTREELQCSAKPALRAATSCSWIQER